MIFEPERLPDGSIRSPFRMEGPGGTVGDGIEILKPGTARWREIDEYLRSRADAEE